MLDNFKEIFLDKYSDDRGYFQETYNFDIKYKIGCDFVQDNESFSKKGVVRGLHYQWDEPMGKLVRCSYGKIIDVIVDVRKDSKNLGKVYYFELSSEKSNALWVPPGFAHGFDTLSDFALVSYKCTSLYNKEGESGIDPFDLDLNIKWAGKNIIVSEKDKTAKSFEDYLSDPKF
ncbi:dTDP-4-dehydrorhamnose 3,5-epimerase [bacterium]|nr:dTDP-4-dehydrorhamnose 3,5-epimerase [bacterium]